MKKIEAYDIRAGDVVRWSSSGGSIKGEVTAITMGEEYPWYTISCSDGQITLLCGRTGYIDMMQLRIVNRPSKEWQTN